MHHKPTDLNQIAMQDLANISGGMKFNPDAKLDTSHIDDLRKGQGIGDRVRSIWRTITKPRPQKSPW